MNRKRIFMEFIIVLSAIVFATCLSFGSGRGNTPATNDPNEMAKLYIQKMNELDRQITTAAMQPITPSLWKKENVDFMLTPALLMQEAMSDEIVITYPTE